MDGIYIMYFMFINVKKWFEMIYRGYPQNVLD